jgi:hypothetical protein
LCNTTQEESGAPGDAAAEQAGGDAAAEQAGGKSVDWLTGGKGERGLGFRV